jgi:hypothetical protein
LLERAPPASEIGVGEFDGMALRAGLQAALEQEKGLGARLRALPTPRRVLFALGLVAFLGAVELALLARADLHLVPLSVLVTLVVVLSALILAGVRLVLRPLQEPSLGLKERALLALFMLAAPVALSFAQPDTGHSAGFHGQGVDLFIKAAACTAHGMVLAAVMIVGLFLLDRRLLRASWAPVLAGALSGVVATLGLQLHCPIPHSAHWLLGHATVGFVVLVGFATYRKLRGG